MESSRSTQSHHRGLSDAGIDPIEGPVEGHVEGRPVRHLDLIILCPQSSFWRRLKNPSRPRRRKRNQYVCLDAVSSPRGRRP